MKKFTCLLITLLSVSSVYTQACAAAATDHAFYQVINMAAYGGAGSALLTTNAITTADATTCVVSGGRLCCDPAKLKTAASVEITKVKTALTEFGSNVARVGGMWAKIATLVNASTANATIDGATAAERSTATGEQLKGWLAYTPTAFAVDFDAFKTQAPTCFTAYWSAIQKIACDGCASLGTWADPARWNADTTTSINAAGCTLLVDGCAKVWYFLHRFGWFAQGVALLNKKKEATAGAVTYTAPADITTIYAAGAAAQTVAPTAAVLTLADIDSSIMKCGASTATATTCDAAAKAVVCRAFFSVWGSTIVAGRAQATFIKDYNPVSTVARRQLAAVAAGTGAIKINDAANSFVDLAGAATITLATPVTLVAGDLTAWSAGYMAPVAGGSGSTGSSGAGASGSTTKSAKVVIGTILSALFAVALLN